MDFILSQEFDINQIKRANNEHEIEHQFETLFDKLNLNYHEQHRLLKGRPDSLIGDIIIDFKYDISDKDLNNWVQSKGRQYIKEYFDVNGHQPSLLIVISESFICYYDNDAILRERRDIEIKSIESLIECLLEPQTINSDQFAKLFGVNSPIYILSYGRLEKHFDDHSGEKTPCFSEWKKHFRLAYHDDQVGKELFLRHSYLSMLLKLILYKEFISPPAYSRDSFKDLEDYFEVNGISLFHYDFFRWVINVKDLCDDFFAKLRKMTFEATDIFRAVYQEMIIAGVRHRLGEYYTPEPLCKKMVERCYMMGDRVLDSSCGSGTFLIECFKCIDSLIDSAEGEKPPEKWFDAINNIFGFDINPIAVLTTKANLILFLKDRKEWLESIEINIYLCNSIDPIELSTVGDISLGEYYNFCIDLLDYEENLRIPSEALKKAYIDRFQVLIKKIYNVWESFEEFDEVWNAVRNSLTDESFENFFKVSPKQLETVTMETLLKEFFEKLHILKKQEKDHIWLFLLNNIVGIRKLLLQRRMDLIITNPPWLTYKDGDKKLKEDMKKLSDQFDIKPAAKNITNIEEAVVFLYKIPQLYLKPGGKIAFVMPRSILVSSQNEKARRFDIFSDISLYEFDDMVFNIDCCCIFGTYDNVETDIESPLKKYPIPCEYLDHQTMELIESYEIEPFAFFQNKPDEKLSVKKLVRPEEKEKVLPIHLSDYYTDFIQGADLIPKSLLLCHIKNTIEDGRISIIDPWISPQAKGKWKNRYYKNERVESKNLFKTTLSRALYPFYIRPYDTFLPLNEQLEYKPSDLDPFSKKHWNRIYEVYQREKGDNLFEVGINYRNKLCSGNSVRENQRFNLKVVFPNAKRLMSAVIKDPESRIFVDSTLYYYGTNNEDEAYYLCGMLNIRPLYKTVKVIADTRHHHKRPLYFNIPKFTGSDKQMEIAEMARECEQLVKKYAEGLKKPKLSKVKHIVKEKLEDIEDVGLSVLKSVSGYKIVKEYEFGD